MEINSYDVECSSIWKYMFKFPNWTPRRSCEILICSIAVFTNYEQISKFVLVFLLLTLSIHFSCWECSFQESPPNFASNINIKLLFFLKSLENQGIFKGNRSCRLIPSKLRLILEAKFGDNLLIQRIQYFIGISIFVHIKLFVFVGRKSNFVQNKTRLWFYKLLNIRPWF